MTLTRATTYVGLASVLFAWLAGAAGAPAPSDSPRAQSSQTVPSTDLIALEVQAQASRLRSRLSSAPAPREPLRNPFSFAPRSVPAVRAARPAMLPAPAEPDRPAEPPLQLEGIAARETPAGPVRTAMITADSDELFMLVEGDTMGRRYRVTTIGAEIVELTDLLTGATRRLVLR